MKPTVTHNPPVMQEVSPATVVLTMSTKAAKAIAALLCSVCCNELDRFDLPEGIIDLLDRNREFKVSNTATGRGVGEIALRFYKN